MSFNDWYALATITVGITIYVAIAVLNAVFGKES